MIALSLGSAAGTGRAARDESRTITITVRPGDTLSRVAARYRVSVDELRRWNPRKTKNVDLIRAGDTLVVRVPSAPEVEAEPDSYWEALYDIRPGDTLSGIARRLGVTVADLRVWNHLQPNAVIRAGAQLKYRRPGKRPPSRSIGRPTDGRLVMGAHLGPGPGYRLRFPRNAYGMESTCRVLRRCTAEVAKAFAGTADLLIGDLSRPSGGPFPPHESHQSGRDADAGYYLADNVQNITLQRLAPGELDYDKNWAMLRCLLRTRRIVRLYMDRAIQQGYVRHARERGIAGEALLDALFEVVGPTADGALVLHAPGHDTHLHVRLACDQGDTACVEEDGDRAFELAVP